MTSTKEKAPLSTEKRDTLRFRATRLSWYRGASADASQAAASQAAPCQAPLGQASAGQAGETRLTVIARLPFVPRALEAYARRLQWRQRAPLLLCIAFLVALAVWLIAHRFRSAPTAEDHQVPVAAPRKQTSAHTTLLPAAEPIEPTPARAEPAASAVPSRPEVAARPSDQRQQPERKTHTPELNPSEQTPARSPKPTPPPDDWF